MAGIGYFDARKHCARIRQAEITARCRNWRLWPVWLHEARRSIN
jgi:hypothetical protein